MDGVQRSSFCPNNEISTVSECVCMQLQFNLFIFLSAFVRVSVVNLHEGVSQRGAEWGQEMKGWQTSSSFSIRAHKLGRALGWGLTVSQWVLRSRLWDIHPISHAANSLWQWTYVPHIIRSIEKRYRLEQLCALVSWIQTYFKFTLSIQIRNFIVWV